jgi:uncharacterized protein
VSDSQARNSAGLPVRSLGRSDIKVSILGFGGGHFCRKHLTEADSIRLVHAAVDAGISFYDNAWEYHGGESERRMGLALADGGRREKVTLMSKVCGRDRKTAEEQLEESLRRLKTDFIDVWQFHEVIYDNDPDWICGVDGALEAAEAARKAGKVRLIGFTGHKHPDIFHRMLSMGFDWDTVQMPVNVVDAHYRSFQNEILPVLNERGIGCIGMKSLGGEAQLVKDAGLTAEACRRYAMSCPISTLVAGIESVENLEQDLDIARNFVQMTPDEMISLSDSVRDQAGDGRHEWFKSTQFYDSSYHREQHSFPPISHVSGKLD